MTVTKAYLKRIQKLPKYDFINYIIDNFTAYQRDLFMTTTSHGVKPYSEISGIEKTEHTNLFNLIQEIDGSLNSNLAVSEYLGDPETVKYDLKKTIDFILNIPYYIKPEILNRTNTFSDIEDDTFILNDHKWREMGSFVMFQCGVMRSLLDLSTSDGFESIISYCRHDPSIAHTDNKTLSRVCLYLLIVLQYWFRLQSQQHPVTETIVFNQDQWWRVRFCIAIEGQLLIHSKEINSDVPLTLKPKLRKEKAMRKAVIDLYLNSVIEKSERKNHDAGIIYNLLRVSIEEHPKASEYIHRHKSSTTSEITERFVVNVIQKFRQWQKEPHKLGSINAQGKYIK